MTLFMVSSLRMELMKVAKGKIIYYLREKGALYELSISKHAEIKRKNDITVISNF